MPEGTEQLEPQTLWIWVTAALLLVVVIVLAVQRRFAYAIAALVGLGGGLIALALYGTWQWGLLYYAAFVGFNALSLRALVVREGQRNERYIHHDINDDLPPR